MRAEQENTRAFLDESEAGRVTPLLTEAESAELDARLERVMDEPPDGPPVEVVLTQRPSMGPMQATPPAARLERVMDEPPDGPPVEVVLTQRPSMGPMQATPPALSYFPATSQAN